MQHYFRMLVVLLCVLRCPAHLHHTHTQNRLASLKSTPCLSAPRTFHPAGCPGEEICQSKVFFTVILYFTPVTIYQFDQNNNPAPVRSFFTPVRIPAQISTPVNIWGPTDYQGTPGFIACNLNKNKSYSRRKLLKILSSNEDDKSSSVLIMI